MDADDIIVRLEDESQTNVIIKCIHQTLKDLTDKQQEERFNQSNSFEAISRILEILKSRFNNNVNQADSALGLCTALLTEDIPMIVLDNLVNLNYDMAKVAKFMVALLDLRIHDQHPATEYFSTKFPLMLEKVIASIEYGHTSAGFLAEFLKGGYFVEQILNLETLRRIIQRVLGPDDNQYAFNANSCALSVFLGLLRSQKDLVAEFVQQNFDGFFDLIMEIIATYDNNYILCRVTMKFLGDFMLERVNKPITIRLVADQKYVQWIIKQQLKARRSYQYEVWNVFKIFACYPDKSLAIKKLFTKKKKKLLEVISNVIRHKERDLDDTEKEEVDCIENILNEMTEE
eukprot:TRINITY_DN14944_c0_g1_i1.p1 TRINITY_DN14944_c0_g1~~TRINITY_DN14944_c0_g1_i1.p1  ORF type:complete len:356 (-),score=26.23 TRINITY_DN14944_c0_g1_i1:240-1274(-)